MFFKIVDSGDFVIPSLSFDCRSFIALHRGLKRLSYIYNDYIYSIITKKQAIKDLQSMGLSKKEAIEFLKQKEEE